jgi:hypothetical protein
MKSHWILKLNILLVVLATLIYPQLMRADRIEMKDGTQLEGIIKKVEGGQVTVEVGEETRVLEILDIVTMDFDTPHLSAGTARLPLEHFLKNVEAQELVGHVQDVEKAAAGIRTLLDQDKKQWGGKQSIPPAEIPEWDATKREFTKALSRYQEVLNDFYFHVLGKVDEYNQLAKKGNEMYVGVKGPFNVGSPLVSGEMKALPLKKFVPSNWYDTIYYNGYNAGYSMGYYEARPE